MPLPAVLATPLPDRCYAYAHPVKPPTAALLAFLWHFHLASLNRRFIRTGFRSVEPVAHHLLSGPLTLAPLSLLWRPCFPLVSGDLLPCMQADRTGCGFDLTDLDEP
ncbi:hypothetical protein TgHK011_009263 [Trichoderma gracile]|nr:hypothetical protein TgHK011_009263 [Trichoderma gracile]